MEPPTPQISETTCSTAISIPERCVGSCYSSDADSLLTEDQQFLSGFGAIIDIVEGPDGLLYMLTGWRHPADRLFDELDPAQGALCSLAREIPQLEDRVPACSLRICLARVLK